MNDHELLLKIYEDLQGVKSKVDSIDERVNSIHERLSEVEEDTKVTRGAVNTILEWADDASIHVIPLLKKKSK